MKRPGTSHATNRGRTPWTHALARGGRCVVFAGGSTAALARAAQEHDALAPAGVQAAHIAHLWNLTLIVTGTVFAAVLLAVLIALARRRTDTPVPPDLAPNTRPERGPRRAVVAASTVSVVLLVALVVADALTDRALSKLPIAHALHIQLTGWQWWWQANF